MDIIDERHILEGFIKEAKDKLVALQQRCPHHEGVYYFDHYFDEWDGSSEYWKHLICKHCGKQWDEDKIDALGQPNPNYDVNPEGLWTHEA